MKEWKLQSFRYIIKLQNVRSIRYIVSDNMEYFTMYNPKTYLINSNYNNPTKETTHLLEKLILIYMNGQK